MEVVTLLLFVGAIWVLAALGMFAWNLLNSGHEHGERLALLPIEDNWTDPHESTHRCMPRHDEGKSESP